MNYSSQSESSSEDVVLIPTLAFSSESSGCSGSNASLMFPRKRNVSHTHDQPLQQVTSNDSDGLIGVGSLDKDLLPTLKDNTGEDELFTNVSLLNKFREWRCSPTLTNSLSNFSCSEKIDYGHMTYGPITCLSPAILSEVGSRIEVGAEAEEENVMQYIDGLFKKLNIKDSPLANKVLCSQSTPRQDTQQRNFLRLMEDAWTVSANIVDDQLNKEMGNKSARNQASFEGFLPEDASRNFDRISALRKLKSISTHIRRASSNYLRGNTEILGDSWTQDSLNGNSLPQSCSISDPEVRTSIHPCAYLATPRRTRSKGPAREHPNVQPRILEYK